MTPVEITQTPWHFTTCLDLLDHWQTGLAGAGAVVAAFVTIGVTLGIERRQAKRELDALRKSLAVELRQQIPRALGVHSSLRGLLFKQNRPFTARMVESLSRMPVPIIYSANAGKIGLLKDDAMDVVMVYTLLEGARDAADRLATTYRPPDDIDPAVVQSTAGAFLGACEYARGVLPRLRTGVASHDAGDETLIHQINSAVSLFSRLA